MTSIATTERQRVMTLRRALPAVLAVLLASALTACGEREEPSGDPGSEPVELVLDRPPSANHAGIYAAKAGGSFEQAGLDVRLSTPSDPSEPLELVSSGRADLAISHEPELLLERAKGAKLVAVGALVQTPLTSIISIGDPEITEPGQLEDRKVGTSGIAYQDAYLKAIAERAGIAPERVRSLDVGFKLAPALLSGRIDAALGAYWNIEGVELRRRARSPRILRMSQVGIPAYNELVIVAREEDVRKRGALLRRFMRALAVSTDALQDDPKAGVDALVKANPDLDRGLQLAQVTATLPAFQPEDEDKPFGYLDPAAWKRFTQWMLDNDLLASPAGANRALTNEFLPGEGI
ncbi:MAG: ABC transporter substrate-binding protein [Solirubrobacteraceae bacterium]